MEETLEGRTSSQLPEHSQGWGVPAKGRQGLREVTAKGERQTERPADLPLAVLPLKPQAQDGLHHGLLTSDWVLTFLMPLPQVLWKESVRASSDAHQLWDLRSLLNLSMPQFLHLKWDDSTHLVPSFLHPPIMAFLSHPDAPSHKSQSLPSLQTLPPPSSLYWWFWFLLKVP